jgi:hypothetical protein
MTRDMGWLKEVLRDMRVDESQRVVPRCDDEEQKKDAPG